MGEKVPGRSRQTGMPNKKTKKQNERKSERREKKVLFSSFQISKLSPLFFPALGIRNLNVSHLTTFQFSRLWTFSAFRIKRTFLNSEF